jgi:hypothetical protein
MPTVNLDKVVCNQSKIKESELNFKIEELSSDILSIKIDDLNEFFENDAFDSILINIEEKKKSIAVESGLVCDVCQGPDEKYKRLTQCNSCNVDIHAKCRKMHSCKV